MPEERIIDFSRTAGRSARVLGVHFGLCHAPPRSGANVHLAAPPPVTHLDISQNTLIEVTGARALVAALPDTGLATLVLGPLSTKIDLRAFELRLQPEPEAATSTPSSINFSKQELGPAELIVIAWWLSTDATAGVVEGDISMNRISGSKHYDNNFSYGVVEFDTDVSQLEAFGSAISKSSVTAIKMTRCGLGSDAMSTLCAAGLFSTLASIDLSGNFISGTKCKSGSYMSNVIDSSTIDSNMTSIVALSETLQSSAITHMNISNCSLGPKSITIVASSLATAGVEAMDLSNNPFDPGDLEAPANMKINVDGCAIPESDDDDY